LFDQLLFTNVSITAIIESQERYASLYVEQLKCTVASLAGEGRVLEPAELEDLVQGCSAGDIPSVLQDHIIMELATCTDEMLDVKTDDCNTFMTILELEEGVLPPVDNTMLATVPPTFFFTITLESTIEEVLADTNIVRTLRAGISSVFKLAADHVAVQFKSVSASAANRRLLQTTASVESSVFLYEDERMRAAPSRLTGGSQADTVALFNGQLAPAMAQIYSSAADFPRVLTIGSVVTDVANMPRPNAARVQEWVLAVRVHVQVAELTVTDVNEIAVVVRAMLVQDVARSTPLTAADVSITGMTTAPNGGTDFVAWLRFSSKDARSVASASLRSGPGRGSTLKALVSFRLSQSASQRLQQIGVQDIFVVTITDREEDGYPDKAEEPDQTASDVSSVPMIAGIAVGSTLLAALVGLLTMRACRGSKEDAYSAVRTV
jgi:hypothetical protein